MRLGAWLDAGMPTAEVVSVCRELERYRDEEDGGLLVDSVWISEAYIGRDAVVLSAAAAQATEAIKIGTAVVNPFTRQPAVLAMTVVTMNELAKGRFILGIGTGESHWMSALGHDFSRAMTIVRRGAEEIRAILDGRPVQSGDDRASLIIRDPDRSRRLYLAAVGPRMCRLAGAEFDGCLLPISTPHLNRTAISDVQAGEAEAKRAPGSCETVATLLFAAGDDVDELRSGLRRKLGLMLTGTAAAALLKRNGLDGGHAQRFHDAIREGGLRDALGKLPDELVDAFCVYGDLGACASRLAEYEQAGLQVAALLCEADQVANLVQLARQLGRSKTKA